MPRARASRGKPPLSSFFANRATRNSHHQGDALRSSILQSPARDYRRSPELTPPLLHDLLLLDLFLPESLVLLATGQQPALAGGEALLELGDLLPEPSGGVVVEVLGLPDVLQGAAVVAKVVQQLALEPQHVIHRYLVHQALQPGPDRDDLLLHGVGRVLRLAEQHDQPTVA